jgi:hypothetical protein
MPFSPEKMTEEVMLSTSFTALDAFLELDGLSGKRSRVLVFDEAGQISEDQLRWCNRVWRHRNNLPAEAGGVMFEGAQLLFIYGPGQLAPIHNGTTLPSAVEKFQRGATTFHPVMLPQNMRAGEGDALIPELNKLLAGKFDRDSTRFFSSALMAKDDARRSAALPGVDHRHVISIVGSAAEDIDFPNCIGCNQIGPRRKAEMYSFFKILLQIIINCLMFHFLRLVDNCFLYEWFALFAFGSNRFL